jgi:hypothetical protein
MRDASIASNEERRPHFELTHPPLPKGARLGNAAALKTERRGKPRPPIAAPALAGKVNKPLP